LQKDFKSEQSSHGGPTEKPQSIYEDETRGFHTSGVVQARVGVKIVERSLDWLAASKRLEDPLEAGPVNGPRVVKIKLGSTNWGEMGAVAIEIVEGKKDRASAERRFELPGKPRFARTTPADNGYEERCHAASFGRVRQKSAAGRKRNPA
jgi:hypothetical protein